MRYFIFPMILIACQGVGNERCNDKFFEALTSDMGGNSNFVVVNASFDGSVKKIAVPNYHLYSLLRSMSELSEQQYRELIKSTVERNEILELPNHEILLKYTVKFDSSINADYRQGLAFFKGKYFEKGVQRKNVVINNTNYVAALLFENCILSRIDDYTGFMVLDENFLSN